MRHFDPWLLVGYASAVAVGRGLLLIVWSQFLVVSASDLEHLGSAGQAQKDVEEFGQGGSRRGVYMCLGRKVVSIAEVEVAGSGSCLPSVSCSCHSGPVGVSTVFFASMSGMARAPAYLGAGGGGKALMREYGVSGW